MKLYLIHCGFYDDSISNGFYEFHINIPVLASALEEAKAKVRKNEEFKRRQMHIDGIQEISIVEDHEIAFQKRTGSNQAAIQLQPYRDF